MLISVFMVILQYASPMASYEGKWCMITFNANWSAIGKSEPPQLCCCVKQLSALYHEGLDYIRLFV